MNNSEYQKILELLTSMNRLDLVNNFIIERSFDEMKNILLLPEWNEDRFKHLLTPTIWNTNYEDIKIKLEMKEWDDDKFKNLLTPNI